jgi:phospholipid transport system substrate-binding protein
MTSRFRSSLAQLAAGLVLLCATAASGAAIAQSPNDVIRGAADELAEQLSTRRDELAADRSALYETVNAIILPRFDREYAAQLVLGRNWRDASADQREAFIDAFYDNLLQKYADGVLEYVVVEGISYVRNYRTEINSEISASSLDAVIERLRNDAQSGQAEVE